MKKSIFSRFEFSNSYKKELIKVVKNMCNPEIGGNKFYDGLGTHYMQNPKEIVELIFELKKHESKKKKSFSSFLEIGFASGINNSFINKFFKFKNLVAIDIVQPLGINSQNFYSNLRFKNLSLICGDSTKSDIIKKVDLLGPYDLIFIDGGHEYEAVKKDFNNYSKFLSKEGVIALHDIKSNLITGVPKFWNELKKKEKKNWNFKEIFESGHQMECGIGIISKK